MTAESALFGRIRKTARLLGLRRFWAGSPTPGNWRDDAASDRQIAENASYAANCARRYTEQCESYGLSLPGARILELGPGTGFGAAAYLSALGATTYVADRWLAPYRAAYHARYYECMASLAEKDPRIVTAEPLYALAKASGYEGGPIRLLPMRAEDLSGELEPCTLDAVVSNAVLEHVEHIDHAAAALFAITKPGGFGFHQIDFRDHRDFDHPLEHLLLKPEAWRALSSRVHWEYGAQRRPGDYVRAFRDAGFAVLRYDCNLTATPEYLADLRGRLPAGDAPSDLQELSGAYVLRRPAASENS